MMRNAYDLGEGLIPSRETSLPPLVEGPIKGELLLHISGIQLVDAPQLGQTLQARAPVRWCQSVQWQHRLACPQSSFATLLSMMTKALNQPPHAACGCHLQGCPGGRASFSPLCRSGCTGGVMMGQASCCSSGLDQTPRLLSCLSAAAQSRSPVFAPSARGTV